MESRSQTWLLVRIVFVLLSMPAWLVIRAQMQDGFSRPPSWYFPLLITGFGAFAVVLPSVLRSDKEWVAPSWRNSLLSTGRPLEGFHLCAWSFLAGAFALLVVGLFREPTDWAWVLPGCIGIGILAGIRLVSVPEHRLGA